MSDEAVAVQEQVTERKFEPITIEIMDNYGRIRKRRFDGACLIGDESSGEDYNFDEDGNGGGGRASYSVALTQRAGIVVLTHDQDHVFLKSFAGFDDLQTDGGLPTSLLSAVAAELGIEYVEEMEV